MELPAPTNPCPSLFEFRQVQKGYREPGGGTVKVLTGFNAVIPGSGITALLGDNGTGKTTLANLATGQDVDYDGEIYHRGKLLSKVEGRDLRSHRQAVAYIGQQFNNIAHLHALNNVAIGRVCQGWKLADARQIAWLALDHVGLAKFARRLPHQLSGGQQQRVAIARALASGADTIVADEPSGNLDERSRDQVMDCFRVCRDQGKAVVMITHSSTLARSCDRAYAVEPRGLRDVTRAKFDSVVDYSNWIDSLATNLEPASYVLSASLVTGERHAFVTGSTVPPLEAYFDGSVNGWWN